MGWPGPARYVMLMDFWNGTRKWENHAPVLAPLPNHSLLHGTALYDGRPEGEGRVVVT